ncbi:hypothetical protein [Streptomyces sp. NPDC002779]|uniref:hypothetical protein n=1 Tax=Streptomyces sp. NPDC002779 TaxID=3364664 RepID=UPI0036C8F9C5
MPSDPYDPAPGDDTPSPLRSRWFIASACLLAVIALLGVLIAVAGGDEPAKASGPKGDPAPAASASPEDPDGCPVLADTSKTVPDRAPVGVRWELFSTVALPVSQASGPAVFEGDVARCYAHTEVPPSCGRC